jgi:type IV pilus secretin PilQ/predicted competence protein
MKFKILKKELFVTFLIIFTSCLYAQNEFEKGGESVSGEELFTYECKNEDLANIIRIIAAKISAKRDFNIIVSQADLADKKVTLRLKRVPLEEALETILKVNNLTSIPIGKSKKIIRILPISRVGQGDAISRSFVLKYLSAGSIQGEIKNMLSPSGKILINAKRNMLTVIDIPSAIKKVDRYIEKIDGIPQQVVIQAKFIEMNWGASKDMGISWNVEFGASGGSRSTTFPFNMGYGGSRYIPDSSAPGGTFTAGTLTASGLSAVLRFVESSSDANVIASPHILTMNNESATINIGSNVPIPKYERNSETATLEITGYTEQKVGVELKVKPSISRDGFIRMELQPNVSEITGYTGPNNERPITSERTAQTKVIIKDGETVVIGGMLGETEKEAVTRVPFLGRIPLLGRLFTSTRTSKDKVDLLMFITPNIMKMSGTVNPKDIEARNKPIDQKK